jgi:hypothetical protein
MPVDSKRLTLNDEPAYVDLIVQQQTPWNRTLQIKDSKTGVVRNLQGRSFIGEIQEEGDPTIIGAFTYVIYPDNSFMLSLSKALIMTLDTTKTYLFDIFLIEVNGIGEKCLSGTIQSEYSVTTVP